MITILYVCMLHVSLLHVSLLHVIYITYMISDLCMCLKMMLTFATNESLYYMSAYSMGPPPNKEVESKLVKIFC